MSAESDARMLANLRQWRGVFQSIVELSPEEFDLLLRIADERDELARKLAETPDERECEHESWESGKDGKTRRCADCGKFFKHAAYVVTSCPSCHHSPHPVGQLCWDNTCGCRVGVVL